MSNIKNYKIENGQAAIPENETVNVCIRMFDGSVKTITLPVTPDILAHITGTRDGSFHCVNLKYLADKLPYCKSYFLPN